MTQTWTAGQMPVLLTLSIWPHPTATHDSTKALSCLLLTARLRSELVFQCLCTSLEQTSPVYLLFWIPDLFSATSTNAPFWPSVSSLVRWLPDLLMTNMAFLWTCFLPYTFWLEAPLNLATLRIPALQKFSVLYCIVLKKLKLPICPNDCLCVGAGLCSMHVFNIHPTCLSIVHVCWEMFKAPVNPGCLPIVLWALAYMCQGLCTCMFVVQQVVQALQPYHMSLISWAESCE